MTAERKLFGAPITATLLAGCSADTPGADSTDAAAADRPWATGPAVQPVLEATSGDDAVFRTFGTLRWTPAATSMSSTFRNRGSSS